MVAMSAPEPEMPCVASASVKTPFSGSSADAGTVATGRAGTFGPGGGVGAGGGFALSAVGAVFAGSSFEGAGSDGADRQDASRTRQGQTARWRGDVMGGLFARGE